MTRLGTLVPEFAHEYKQRAKEIWAAKKEAAAKEEVAMDVHFLVRQAVEHVLPHLVYLQCSYCTVRCNCKLMGRERTFDCGGYKQ